MLQINFGLITIIAMLFEKKDAYTAFHQKRVADLAGLIADRMKLEQSRKDILVMASSIHDIGKISMPIEILCKPLKLDEEEFDLLKLHPEIGCNIVTSAGLPETLAEIILQHHEKNDGSGYPRGLNFEEIMLEAKILTVADVVEAVASDRPYRQAKGVDCALDIITAYSGIHYDPGVVDVCREIIIRKEFLI